jgi:hypothetical protein
MTRVRKSLWQALVLAAALVTGPAGTTGEPISFPEVFDLIRANLVGVKEAELSQAAALGLIKQLGPQVTLIDDSSPKPVGQDGANFSVTVLDGAYAYVRVGDVAAGLDRKFVESFDRLRLTNRLKGLVLDLRFAGGRDYAAAVAFADQFFGSEQPLADWGEGLRKSTDKTNAVTIPVAVIVNQKTRGPAEVVAGILRHTDVALLIGTNTAGQANIAKEFTLKGGQRLRVAVAPVKVAAGKELPFSGLPVDIQIEVNPDDERLWYEDAYKILNKASGSVASSLNDTNTAATNRPPRRRLNEAELVRLTREGQAIETEPTNAPARSAEPAPPLVNDPALARALDLLKGIAVVSRFRPS